MISGSKRAKTSGRTVRKKRGSDKRKQRDKYLQKVYGISLTEYEKLAAYNGGQCWICPAYPKPGKNLAVDHDHRLEKAVGRRRSIRGLLCFMCNKRLIGRRRREHSALYRRAANYLDSDEAQELLGEHG